MSLDMVKTNEQEGDFEGNLQEADLRRHLSQHSEDIDARTNASLQLQRSATRYFAHSFHIHTWLLENELDGM